MARKTKTPQPIAVTTICSVCGLGWELHGPDPTTDDCIKLLKAELARRPIVINRPYTVPVPAPYPVPYPVRPWGPVWYGTGTQVTCQNTSPQISYHTPRAIETTCSAVATSSTSD
jgi:hypothetical protein